MLTEKNEFGFRPIDVGPVTMGVRLSSPKAGCDIYQDLVYPKGAYILHMIRMMMWTPKDGDARFKAMMHDFVKTYTLQAATTEDFKAIVEKHMLPGMDLEGTHTMDWFFREYVYGTDLPAYHFESDFAPSGDGWKVHFKLVQSGVDAKFVNVVAALPGIDRRQDHAPGPDHRARPHHRRPEFAIAQALRAHQTRS